MKLYFQSSLFLMIIIFLLFLLQKSVEANEYEDCKKPSLCGSVSISYPFYDEQSRPEYCGYPGFKLNCSDDYIGFPEISVTNSSEKYLLLNMKPNAHTITVARKDMWNSFCPDSLVNTSLNSILYEYPDTVENFTLYYDCPAAPPSTASVIQFPCPNKQFSSPINYVMIDGYGYNPSIQCKNSIVVPLYNQSVDIVRDITSLQNAFRAGFELEWMAENESCDKCHGSGGECGYDKSQQKFTCYHGFRVGRTVHRLA